MFLFTPHFVSKLNHITKITLTDNVGVIFMQTAFIIPKADGNFKITNGLDPVGIHEIRTLIRSLPEKYNCTVFVSSHLLSEVELMADTVGILNHGRLLFEGTLEQLRSGAAAQGYPTDNLEDTFLALIDADNRQRGAAK